MEIIIAILFFSLASAVCLRLFAGARTMSDRDKDLNNAILWSQNLSESFYGCKGNVLMIKNLYPTAFFAEGEKESDGIIILFFDENWELVEHSLAGASYEAIIIVEKDLAANVYSDIKDIPVSIKGNAITGRIAIMDIKNRSEGYMKPPENESDVLFKNMVDVFVGNE